MVSDNTNKDSYASRFRRRRMQQLASLIERKQLTGLSVLDIGGTQQFWELNLQYLPPGAIAEIDIVNLPPQQATQTQFGEVSLNVYAGNALDRSSFRLDNYDLVHSNSVIEHVGNLSAQLQLASSIPTLGKYYWVQTPAKCFPLEPHFYVPLFAYLPLSVRAALLRTFNLGFHKREENWLQSRITCEETRLINYPEYRALFPGAEILKEKILFLTKSYTATNLS